MNDLPSLKALQVFEACVRLGSFTRAAKSLNVGQPAISHQIHALERDLGLALFERRGVQAVPTSAALGYYQTICAALSSMATASSALRKSTRAPGIALATYPGIAMYWLMPKLSALKLSRPDLSIRVTTAERDQDIPFDDSDCAIVFGDGRWRGHESRLLFHEVVTPVAAPGVAARCAGRSSPIDARAMLATGPLIHLEDLDGRWFTWTDWRDQRAPDAAMIDPGMTVTNHGVAIHQALMGQGIALGWRGVIDELIASGLLVALDFAPLSSTRGYYLVAKSDFFASDLGQSLVAALNAFD